MRKNYSTIGLREKLDLLSENDGLEFNMIDDTNKILMENVDVWQVMKLMEAGIIVKRDWAENGDELLAFFSEEF